MQLKDMFIKNISRSIQGVIKIGQDQDTEDIVFEELDEYVVTNELSNHFKAFFSAYGKSLDVRTDKIGVWISGFFGSGKSHFLKILSYILGNENVKGEMPYTYFENKITDRKILENMKNSGCFNTDIILFNIDAKSDADNKQNKDAIVKVFMKVFNEKLGYCGSMPWIADIERQMDKDGVYQNFKFRFKELSGSDWKYARDDFYFEEDNILQALADTTKMSIEAARNWYQKSESNYSLSIDQFAKKVREYIESNGDNHRVIFLCDEIGQYIGSDSNLMLNLQTVIEQLGMECGGKAWVIATSQEDIDSITKVNRDLFSKIIGRFNTKLSLSSANVDEVIRKRLLEKNKTAENSLKMLFAEKEAVLKNVLTFSSDTPTQRIYRDEHDFIDNYPFIPYQFNLLQQVFTGIRTHGASGKHLSQGERSLLNAFQEAAKQFLSFDEGLLIPFDAFYHTVETFLDHNIRSVIIKAQQTADAGDTIIIDYDVSVLQVLFMLKYIRDFMPPNLENLATIMITSINDDKLSLKRKIDGSLRRLLEEKLIIKDGNEFVFLTHDEQDVNREIREIKIDMSEILGRVGNIIFTKIYAESKFRYNQHYDFVYNTMIDDRARGAQRGDIGLRVLTPYFVCDEFELKSISYRESSVVLKMPNDISFYEEMELVLQIETFLKRNMGKTQSDAIEDIKTNKSREAETRAKRCQDLLVEALKKSTIYVNNEQIDVKEKAPTDRINEAFKLLIESMYSKLNYVNKFYLNTEELRDIIRNDKSQLIMCSDTVTKEENALATAEIIDTVDRNCRNHMPVTIDSITKNFKKAPFGWNEIDIEAIILKLFVQQEIKLELNGETVEKNLNAVNYVTKRDYADRLLVKTRIKVSPKQIAKAKSLAKEIFGMVALPEDEDGLMEKWKELCQIELYQRASNGIEINIKDLLNKYNSNAYPGKYVLDEGKKLFEYIKGIKGVQEFYDCIESSEASFLDYAEDIIDIRNFFKTQVKIFDEALKSISLYESNSTYILDEEAIKIITNIKAILKMKSPYNSIKMLNELLPKFSDKFFEIMEIECAPIREIIESDRKAISEEFTEEMSDKIKKQVIEPFDTLLKRLENAKSIYEAVAMREESDRIKLRMIKILDYEKECIEEEKRRIEREKQQKENPTKEITKPVFYPKRKSEVPVSIKNILGGTKVLKTKEDIDKIVEEIRQKLMKELKEDTIIKLL